jgi:hypothetical protein
MLDRLRSVVALTAVVGCSVCGGCGGSPAGDHAPASTPSIGQARGPSGIGTALAQPSPASPSPETSPAAASAIASKCAAADAADAGQFTVCLAAHGVKLPDSGALTACIQAAHDVWALQACLTKAGR